MNLEDYKTAELDLKRIARIRALGIMALAWLVSDVLYLLHVVATRMILSGQVSRMAWRCIRSRATRVSKTSSSTAPF